MPDTCYYLAYGSNLHPLRLYERIPSSTFLDVIELSHYHLEFHKHCTVDDSGKCNLLYTGEVERKALGAVYAMAAEHKPLLDEFEGVGYETKSSLVPIQGEDREVFWYQALDDFINNTLEPYDWYHEIVTLGAKFHNFPEHYLEHLQSFNAIPDPNQSRHRDRYALIERMKNYRHDESSR